MSISVIIPAFNAANHLANALTSVLSQTLGPDEVIVIDDGSIDSTPDVVLQFPGVKYIYQDHAGAAVARNTGIEAAMGEFVAFLDSDDTWLPHHLSGIVNNIKKSGALWGCSAVQKPATLRNVCKKWTSLLKNDSYFENFFSAWGLEAPFHTDGMVISRDILSKIGKFNTSLKVGEDLDLWFRIALVHPKIAFQAKTSVIYNRGRPGSLMSTYGSCSDVSIHLILLLRSSCTRLGINTCICYPAFHHLIRRIWGNWYRDGDVTYLRKILSLNLNLPFTTKILISASVFTPSLVHVAIKILKGLRHAA